MSDVGGYIKLHRKITDWEWYHDTNTFRVFLHILLKANFTDGRFEGKVIRRGQLVTSLPSLAKQTGLTVRNIRTSLDHLFLTGELTVERQPRYRIITVVKYDDYQSSDSLTDRQSTGNRQDTDSQVTGNRQQYKNNKNIRKEEYKNNSPSESTARPEYVTDVKKESFELFWKEYPKKVAKADAWKAWSKIEHDGVTIMAIMNGLKKWMASDQWNRDGGQYIPYPASWLRGRRWEDEVQAPAAAPTRAPAIVNAQNYGQRDYSQVQDEIMERQRRRIEERLRRQQSERDYSDVPGQIVDGLAQEIKQAKKEGII